MPKGIDLKGRVFGRRVVVKRATHSNSEGILWIVRCECGTMSVVAGKVLRRRGLRLMRVREGRPHHGSKLPSRLCYARRSL
jgi:hypothetical protein